MEGNGVMKKENIETILKEGHASKGIDNKVINGGRQKFHHINMPLRPMAPP